MAKISEGKIKAVDQKMPSKSVSSNYAGFWVRLLAAIIDWVAIGIVQAFFNYVLKGPIANFVSLALTFGYAPFMLYQYQATLGKMALGLKVVSENGKKLEVPQLLLREWVGKFLSGIVFGLGFLWVGFDEKKQGWHDKLGHTLVIREK